MVRFNSVVYVYQFVIMQLGTCGCLFLLGVVCCQRGSVFWRGDATIWEHTGSEIIIVRSSFSGILHACCTNNHNFVTHTKLVLPSLLFPSTTTALAIGVRA